jgi:hypothetical protein
VKRFFFHVVKSREVIEDTVGRRLPDLGAVVEEAERVAVSAIISDGTLPREWTAWKLDVKDEDGTRIFFYPFEEVSLHFISEAKALEAKFKGRGSKES